MCKEKIKLFLAKNSTLVAIIFLIVAFLIISRVNFLGFFRELSSSEFAVYGTLLGAVVGGFFTLIGTSFMNKQQLKAQIQIKKRI